MNGVLTAEFHQMMFLDFLKVDDPLVFETILEDLIPPMTNSIWSAIQVKPFDLTTSIDRPMHHSRKKHPKKCRSVRLSVVQKKHQKVILSRRELMRHGKV